MTVPIPAGTTFRIAALAACLAACGPTEEAPRVLPFCGQQPLDASGPIVDIVVTTEAEQPPPGPVLVRVDPVDDPDGFQLEDGGPTAIAATLRASIRGSGFGCASTIADTLYFDVRGAALPKAWLRVKTERPVRIHLVRGDSRTSSGRLIPGESTVVDWSATVSETP